MAVAGSERRGVLSSVVVRIITSIAVVAMVGFFGVARGWVATKGTMDSGYHQMKNAVIELTDDDAGRSYMYDVDRATPGDSISRCIRITYRGDQDGRVKLYMTTPIDTLGPYLHLTIDVGTRGAPSFPACTGFQATRSIYSGTLSAFQAQHQAAAHGLEYSPNGSAPWCHGDSVIYRMTVTLQTATRPPGADFSGQHTYTWRADPSDSL